MRTFSIVLASLALAACGDDSTSTGGGGSTSTGTGAGGSGAEGAGETGGGGSTSTSAGGGAGAGGGGGGSGGCTPDDVESCYDGPPDTVDVAPCAAGQRTCLADGTFGPCEGQVLPGTDLCSTPADEDCTGAPNEGCLCAPGAQVPCYTGPAGTQGVGACTPGVAVCDASGESTGPCEGDVLPGVQTCTLPAIDADCDGTANMGCCVSGEWTFADLATTPTHVLFESSVAVGPAGDVWVVYSESGAMKVIHRAPGGALATYQPSISHYAHDIAIDGLGNVHISFVGGSSVYHAVKGPADADFASTEVGSTGGVAGTTIAVNPAGEVHIVVRGSSVRYYRRLAGAVVFEETNWLANVLDGAQSAGLDPQGNLHVIFTEKLFAQSSFHDVTDLFVPAGSTTFAALPIDTNATGGNVGFDVDPVGGLHVTYGDAFATDVVRATKLAGEVAWSVTDCIPCQGPARTAVVGQTSGATDVVYLLGAQAPLHYVRLGPGGGAPQELSSSSYYHSLAGDSAGGLHLVYVDRTSAPSSTLKYGYRCP